MGELTAEILKRQLLSHMIKQTEDGHMLSAARAALLLLTKTSLLLEAEILSLQREGTQTTLKQPMRESKIFDGPHLNWSKSKNESSMRERHTSGTGIGSERMEHTKSNNMRERFASEEPAPEGRSNRAASIIESPQMSLKKELPSDGTIEGRMNKLANQVNQKRRASLASMDLPSRSNSKEENSDDDDSDDDDDSEEDSVDDYVGHDDLSPAAKYDSDYIHTDELSRPKDSPKLSLPTKLPPNVQSWSKHNTDSQKPSSKKHQQLDTAIAQIRRASLNEQNKFQNGSISLDDEDTVTKNRRLSNAALSLLHAFTEDSESQNSTTGKSSEYSHHKNSDSNYSTGAGYQLNVVIRKRPTGDGETDCVKCDGKQVVLYEDKVKVDLTKYTQAQTFKFDHAYSENETTGDVYQNSISELISNLFNGGTSTAFCFGQTASGKTFTLFGAGGGQVDHNDMESGGVYMLAAQDIFNRLSKRRDVYLSISMFEIYGQKVRDLLAQNKELAALEDSHGVLQLVGLKEEECTCIEEFIEISNTGRHARSTTATGANNTSSRSHAAMLFRLFEENDDQTKKKKCVGKFSLIDLAGSERGADNEATDKKTQMEGRQINTSLLALKEVIRAKELGRKHAPFRQSRLTQVLEESLTGNQCHTTVMGCISPCVKDTQQTLNTLRYAASLQGKKRPTLAGVATSVVAMNKMNKLGSSPGGGNRRPPPVSPRGSKLHTSSNPLHGSRVPAPRSSSVKEHGNMRKIKSMSSVKDPDHLNKSRRATATSATAGGSTMGSHHDHVMKGHNMRRRQSLSTRDDLALLLEPLGLESFIDPLRSAANGSSARHIKDLGVVKFVNLGIPKIRALKLQKKAEELIENISR